MKASRPVGLCEVCLKRPATRRARFKAYYLDAVWLGPVEEERMVEAPMEKRVCEQCLQRIREAKNVREFVFERL